MYIPTKYQMHTVDEIASFIKRINEVTPVWSDLLTIDYFYHHHCADYDEGLSFIDRLNKKIGHFHPEWDIEGLKRIIRTSDNPQYVYVDIVKYLLEDPHDVFYYGI